MASAPPRAFSDGGYDHDFVDPSLPYECPLCLLVAREPVQTECGHTFCEDCWETHLDSSGEVVKCPIDNQAVYIDRVFKDAKTKRTIGDLKAWCDYRKHGCEKISELRYLQDHMTKCEYQPVPCDLFCGASIPKVKLDTHMREQCPKREVPCPNCDEKICAQDLQAHEADCPMVNVGCEWCGGELRMKDALVHQAYCLDRPTYCSFALQGCLEKVIRRDMKAHHEANVHHHMELINSTVTDVTNSLGAGVVPVVVEDDISKLPYELPPLLCGKVNQVAVARQVGASGDMATSMDTQPQMTIYDKVVDLESKNAFLMGVSTEMKLQLNALVNENANLRAGNGRLAEPLSDQERRSKAEIASKIKELEGQNKAEIENKTKEMERRNKAEMAKAIKEIQAESKAHLDKKLTEIDARNNKISRGELVQDGYYTLPVFWTTVLDKTAIVRSPLFYTKDGYKLFLETEWWDNWKGVSKFVVAAVLNRGENDDRAGMWPWCGENLTLTVRVQETGKVYEAVEVGTDSDGKRRPSLGGNTVALISVSMEGYNDRNVIHITLKRKVYKMK